jgi:UDP-glucose 4-epimerase
VRGGEVRIYGDGHQTRDFTYVGDVVRSNLLAATAPGAAGPVCNVACGQQTNLLALLVLLAEPTGRPAVWCLGLHGRGTSGIRWPISAPHEND